MPSETSPSETQAVPAAIGWLVGASVSRPSVARLWDLAGGGADSFRADRDLFQELAEVTANFSDLATANRRFVRGAANFLATELGIKRPDSRLKTMSSGGCSGRANRSMSPISATSTAARAGPIPGICCTAA
jgi:hypothetical protein